MLSHDYRESFLTAHRIHNQNPENKRHLPVTFAASTCAGHVPFVKRAARNRSTYTCTRRGVTVYIFVQLSSKASLLDSPNNGEAVVFTFNTYYSYLDMHPQS